ncbi:MAG: PilZ domain-containing protein [Candidatus Acidiferrales bacterium]
MDQSRLKVKQRRKHDRVALELPLLLSWSAKSKNSLRATGISRNLSSNGIFFLTQARPPVGASIRFKALLPPMQKSASPLCMEAAGQVVRVEPAARAGKWNGVAAVHLRHTLRQWWGNPRGE